MVCMITVVQCLFIISITITIPLYGIRNPFAFDISVGKKNVPRASDSTKKDSTCSSKKNLEVGDTIHSCRVMNVSDDKVILKNPEGQIHKIDIPRDEKSY